ncbi:MAG: Mor transcription activator family protein, partial [Intestinibacter bartlettii]
RSLGGENTYVPKEGEEDDIKARNDKIYEKFLSGKSIKELAREYSMTTKWIRKILKSYEQLRKEENDYNINSN